jgi:hypothetical protein
MRRKANIRPGGGIQDAGGKFMRRLVPLAVILFAAALGGSLREHRFDTVLGAIDFDEKGDLAVQNPVWWVWRGGTYMPLEQDATRE